MNTKTNKWEKRTYNSLEAAAADLAELYGDSTSQEEGWKLLNYFLWTVVDNATIEVEIPAADDDFYTECAIALGDSGEEL